MPGPHVALCVATRGTGHMQAPFGAWRELIACGVPYTLCPCFGLPLPEAQNEITRQGLASPADVLWFVEEDQLLPVGVLAAMLGAYQDGHPIVSVDYRTVAGDLMIARHPTTGEVLLTPMGCLLVARVVFSAISDPPFQCTGIWELRGGAWHDTGRRSVMGDQDGHFSREVLRAGYAIHALPDWEVGHLRLQQRGGRTNAGADEVRLIGGRGDLQWSPPDLMRPQRRAKLAALEWGMAQAPAQAQNNGAKEDGMAMTYLRSPHGTVIDLDEVKVAKFLKSSPAKWTEISKEQFDKALVAQQAHRAQRREEQLAELNDEEGRDNDAG